MNEFFILKGSNVELRGPRDNLRPSSGTRRQLEGEFDVDEESYKAMKAQIAKRGVDLVVDYEHQTLKGSSPPLPDGSRSSNWRTDRSRPSSSGRPEGRSTSRTRSTATSPVVNVRKSDNKATGLHSLALTNTPAIEGMTAIVNSETFEGGQNNMEIIKKLAELLGLGEDANEEQVMEALKACVAENKALKEGQQPPPPTKRRRKQGCV